MNANIVTITDLDYRNFMAVDITLVDGLPAFKRMPNAFVWVDEDKRLSDIMNDDRIFLPVYKQCQTRINDYHMMIVNKSSIAIIEERLVE